MKKILKKINLDSFWIYSVFLWLLSLLYRLSFVLESNFPLHDGGFFYTLIVDLQTNHFQLPLFSSFNQDSIPFAYPPFAFYFTGILGSILHIKIINLLRFLPSIISSFTVPLFAFLALVFFSGDKKKAMFAALCFALLPLSNIWVISGGGITRSFGDVFCILSLLSLLSGLKSGKVSRIWLVPAFSSLTVLSHPEAAFFLVYSIPLIIFFYKKQASWKKIFTYFLIIGGCTVVLTSPWWIILLYRYGTGMLQPLFDSGFSRLGTILQLFDFGFTAEPALPVLCFLGIIGIIISIGKKDYFLLLWLILPFFVQVRAADQRVTLPIALAAGESCFAIFHLLFEKNILPRKLALSICGFFIIFVLASTTIAINQTDDKIPSTVISAINWLKTQDDQKNVLVVQPKSWVYDSTTEWVATLSGHHTSVEVQGYEWKSGFSERIVQHEDIIQCFTQGPDCVFDWGKRTKSDLVFVPTKTDSASSNSETMGLIKQLKKDDRFTTVFANNGAVIFQFTK